MNDLTASSGASDLGQISPTVHAKRSQFSKHPTKTNMRVDAAVCGEAVSSSKMAIQRIADVRHHMEMCTETLKKLEVSGMEAVENGRQLAIGVSPVTIRTIAACLSELLKLEWTQPHRDSCHDLCKLLDCPQQPVLREAIHHTIEVLEATKFRFESKELKRLRESLEALLGNSVDFSPYPKVIGTK